MIIRDIKHMLRRPVSLFCVLIYTGVLLLGILEDITGETRIGCFEAFYFTENYGIATLLQSLIFPIAAAGCYFDERKGHYDWLMQMRSGQLRYCLSKITAVVLGGIILYMSSVALFFLLCIFLNSDMIAACTADYMAAYMGIKSGLWYHLASSGFYWVGVALYVFLYSLCIGIYNMIALCVSVFCRNRYVFYAFPFLLTRIGFIFGGYFSSTVYTPIGREICADGGVIRCIAMNLLAYAVLGCLYYRELKWRSVHG